MRRMFMENKRESKGAKFKSYDGAMSPINLMNVASSRRSRLVFDPYASDSSDSPSPLMKFLRSVDPASPGASSPPFATPVKVEEDVIVMDGISVTKSNKGIGEVRMRSPLMSSNSANCSLGKSNSSASSSSSGSGGRRSGAENSKPYKNRLCHFWETSGICQFGSECQFAHGKEDLRYHRSSGKIKLEISKLNISSGGSSPSPSPSPSYGSKLPRHNPIKAAAAAAAEEETFILPSLPSEMACASPIPSKQLSGTSAIPITTDPPACDWSPQNDGIEVTLPGMGKSPSKEEVDAYIGNVLYGNGTRERKRLPVFVEICPDS